jgi:hypothetical protein
VSFSSKPKAVDSDAIGRLKEMIRRLLSEIQEHNAEYQHRTPPALIEEATHLIGDDTGSTLN